MLEICPVEYLFYVIFINLIYFCPAYFIHICRQKSFFKLPVGLEWINVFGCHGLP